MTADTEITALIECLWQTGPTAQMSAPPRMYRHLSCLSFSSWTKPLQYWVGWVRSVIGKVKPKPCLHWRYLVQHSSFVILLEVPEALPNISLLHQPLPPSIKSVNLIPLQYAAAYTEGLGVHSGAHTSVSNVDEATNITAKCLKVNYFLWQTHIKTW